MVVITTARQRGGNQVNYRFLTSKCLHASIPRDLSTTLSLSPRTVVICVGVVTRLLHTGCGDELDRHVVHVPAVVRIVTHVERGTDCGVLQVLRVCQCLRQAAQKQTANQDKRFHD